MADEHTRLLEEVMLAASEAGHRLWNNNRGSVRMPDGSWLTYGVGPNGASDLLGLTRRLILPEHIGQTWAVFTAVEGKTGKQTPRKDQEQFLQAIERLGGVATWGTDPDDILKDLR